MLAHATGATIHEDGLQDDNNNTNIFSEKSSYACENISLPEHKYVQTMDHGGWLKFDEISFNLLEHFLTLHVNVR